MALSPLALEMTVSNIDGSDAVTFQNGSTDLAGACAIKTFTNKLGTGYEGLNADLFRDFRKTYNSPRILQHLTVKDGTGYPVWEGRVNRVPGSRAQDVNASGYYSALKDIDCVAEVYTDCNTGNWGGMPLNRRAAILAAATYAPEDGTSENGTLITRLAQPTWTAGSLPATELWYTAPPGVNLASITVSWQRGSAAVSTGGTSHIWTVSLGTDDALASADSTGDLEAAGPATITPLTATTTGRRYAVLAYAYSAAVAGADSLDRSIFWTSPIVKGDHGVTNIYASEVIKHVLGKYCSGTINLDSSLISDTTYAINQLVFDAATPEDVILKCNAYHFYEFGIWDQRKPLYRPMQSLTDYDYELSIFRGDYLDPSGPEVDDDEPCNCAWVYYVDALTGRSERVGPLQGTATMTGVYDSNGDASLLVTNDENPANRAGILRDTSYSVTYPCTRADAIQLGATKLAEKQIWERVGTGMCVGYAKNRAGQMVPGWQIKSGDRVKYSHEDTVRRVFGVSVTPATDNAPPITTFAFEKLPSTWEGINERILNGLAGANVTSA
jgi:hypothetical protein